MPETGPNRPARLLNLTPHSVVLRASDGTEAHLRPGGPVPRLPVQTTTVGEVQVADATIPLVRECFGPVDDLPEPSDDVLFVVSRMVVDAFPRRRDLVCPTGLLRDDAGQVVGATALLVGRDHRGGDIPDHLVVLAGGNPLPNLQAIVTLAPRTVSIVASPETLTVARSLRSAVTALTEHPTVSVVVAADANDRGAVMSALGTIEPGWGLSYTGGTKVMAAQARLAYERWGDGREAHASIVDGQIRFDDGTRRPLDGTSLTIRSLARLHGHRLVGGTEPRASRMDLKRVEPALRERLASGSRRTKVDWNDRSVAGLPRSSRRLLAGAGGAWLESLVGACVRDVADEVVVNPRLRIGGRGEDAPELDVVARIGWKVVLLSCTVDHRRSVRKLKLMEAQRRAEQLGGQRAVAGLVCLGTATECASLTADISSTARVSSPVLVAGRADLLACLAGDRSALQGLIGEQGG